MFVWPQGPGIVFLMKLRAEALKLLTKAIFCPDFDLPN